MALKTGGKRLAMGRLFMATAALRHNFRPVLFQRIIGMQLLMAILTLETMPLAFLFNFVKNPWVALAALVYSQGFYLSIVRIKGGRILVGLLRLYIDIYLLFRDQLGGFPRLVFLQLDTG